MDAKECGATIGNLHLRNVNLKQTTVTQFSDIAHREAKQNYKTPEKQQEFLKGWFAYTQQYLHMFKDWPTQRRIRGVILECAHCGSVAEVEYNQAVEVSVIVAEQKLPCPVCGDEG